MESGNLLLSPHSPAHLRALIESAEQYQRQFGMKVADGVREFVAGPLVTPSYMASLLAETETVPWKHGFAVVHVGRKHVIGVASFKGPPTDDGVVEIAYGIAPAEENKGFATEVVRLLLTIARDTKKVRLVCAHTLAEPNASNRVLQKSGFNFAGEVIDPEDGLIWRWEKEIADGK